MNRILKFSIVLIMFVGVSYAQQAQALNKMILDYDNTRSTKISEIPNLVGTNYINEQFSEANLTDFDQTIMVRFDAYSNEMEGNVDGSVNYLKKTLGTKVSFLDPEKVYQIFNFQEGNESKLGYFVVINEGDKGTLLEQEKVEFEEEVIAKTNFDKYKPPTFSLQKSKYFLGDKKNFATELPRKTKDFFKLFGANANQIESYAKANKLGVKKGEDLIKIFGYYNSL